MAQHTFPAGNLGTPPKAAAAMSGAAAPQGAPTYFRIKPAGFMAQRHIDGGMRDYAYRRRLWVDAEPGTNTVTLRCVNTDIVRILASGEIVLTTGGWFTVGGHTFNRAGGAGGLQAGLRGGVRHLGSRGRRTQRPPRGGGDRRGGGGGGGRLLRRPPRADGHASRAGAHRAR